MILKNKKNIKGGLPILKIIRKSYKNSEYLLIKSKSAKEKSNDTLIVKQNNKRPPAMSV